MSGRKGALGCQEEAKYEDSVLVLPFDDILGSWAQCIHKNSVEKTSVFRSVPQVPVVVSVLVDFVVLDDSL